MLPKYCSETSHRGCKNLICLPGKLYPLGHFLRLLALQVGPGEILLLLLHNSSEILRGIVDLHFKDFFIRERGSDIEDSTGPGVCWGPSPSPGA